MSETQQKELAQKIDAERLTLILHDLRLPAVKHAWPDIAMRADREAWPDRLRQSLQQSARPGWPL